MESKELKVSADNAHAAYKNADENGKKLLENLFGKDMFAPKSVTERVKTFDDACRELGNEHPLVKAYDALCCVDTDKDLEVYAKLRIIVAALNEGWKPQFTKDEYRYYPWFQSCNKGMSDEERKALFHFGGVLYHGELCSFMALGSCDGCESSYTYISTRLALKSENLAIYCGKQFIDLWADLMMTT